MDSNTWQILIDSCSQCCSYEVMFLNSWCDVLRNRQFPSPLIVLPEVAKKQPSEQPSELMGTLCR